MKILVTGAAGFIGFHTCYSLANQGHEVYGIDNINNYYNVDLKYARLKELGILKKDASIFLSEVTSSIFNNLFKFIRINIEDSVEVSKIFKKEKFDIVCNLAAQAGVRYSIENPQVYIDSNIQGFLNILECCRHYGVEKLVYASSSSVYGNSQSTPFRESDNVDHPISLYAATKKSNELMAHCYSNLYKFKTIGLRFFTVYGPWGRPDMAMFLFADAILNDRPINIFNDGKLSRDFTYIDDIVNGIISTLLKKSKSDELYQLYNIGNNKSVELLDFINEIEQITGKKAIKNMLPMQAGDVYKTFADSSRFIDQYNYSPNTSIKKGIEEFIKWFKIFYKTKNDK